MNRQVFLANSFYVLYHSEDKTSNSDLAGSARGHFPTISFFEIVTHPDLPGIEMALKIHRF